MSRRRGDAQTLAFSEGGHRPPKFYYVRARFLNVSADAGSNFNHRLVHLGFYLLAQDHLPFFYHLGYVRAQLTRHRVDNLKLFLDSKSEVRHVISDFRFAISDCKSKIANWHSAI